MLAKTLISGFFLLSSGAALAQDAVVPVCDRTAAVAEFIVQQINTQQGTTKTCADITQDDLDTIERISVAGKGITQFKPGDFSGLQHMKILNIRSNPYTTLIEGLFKGLDSLETLVIISTSLRYLPDDFLADTPNMKNVHWFRTDVRTISESVFQNLARLEHLELFDIAADLNPAEKARLEAMFAGTTILNYN